MFVTPGLEAWSRAVGGYNILMFHLECVSGRRPDEETYQWSLGFRMLHTTVDEE